MWFGIVFAIVVEIVPLNLRSTTIGVFLFVMNNIGGNLPILVEPTRLAIGFRESLYIFYAGFYGISMYDLWDFDKKKNLKKQEENYYRNSYLMCVCVSLSYLSGSIMFLLTMFLMDGPVKQTKNIEDQTGYDNCTFTNDEDHQRVSSTMELPRLSIRPPCYENSQLWSW